MTTLVIDQYGPLLKRNRDRISLENFNLFYGQNESGKTLLIEALIKLLYKKQKELKDLDRVEKKPDGYIVLETDEKESYKFPEDGDLSEIVSGLNTVDYCNIFIIRDSDLSIIKENEFYTKITDHLIGLRTADLVKLERYLGELGNLTPTGLFSKELGNRIKKAESSIETINELLSEIVQNKFDALEKNKVICKKNFERVEKEIKNLEDARRREEYETGNTELSELETNLIVFKNLEHFDEDDEKTWALRENIINSDNSDINKKNAILEIDKKEFEKLNANYDAMAFDFSSLEQRKKVIDESIRKYMDEYDQKSQKFKTMEEKTKFLTPLVLISLLIFLISLTGIIVNPSIILYCSFTGSLIVLVISLMYKFHVISQNAWLRKTFELIKLNSSKFELNADSITQIYSNIQKFDEEFDRKKEVLDKTGTDKTRLEVRIAEIEFNVSEKEEQIQQAQQIIDEIKRKSSSESHQDYIEKLRLKNEYKTKIERNETILKDHFDEIEAPLEEKLEFWAGKIKALENFKDKAKETQFNEELYAERETEKQDLINQLTEIEGKLADIRIRFKNIEATVKEILLDEDELNCDTSIELELIKDKLQDFISSNNHTKENVLKIKELFQEIETEEKAKISGLFSNKSSVSQYFKEITDGLYEGIIFDVPSGQIQVKHKNGKILDVVKLSGGTYDQLYFAIRLALGEKLLEGKPGFFILDDPFIKADLDRLKTMLAMLKKIVQNGWQILFFSTKFEVPYLLKDDIEHGNIKLFHIAKFFSVNSP